MKIIVIGLGSMGKRRIRLLSEHKDIQLFGIDSQESRCAEVKEKFGLKCFASIAEAVAAEHPDAAVISTSPLSHAALLRNVLGTVFMYSRRLIWWQMVMQRIWH